MRSYPTSHVGVICVVLTSLNLASCGGPPPPGPIEVDPDRSPEPPEYRVVTDEDVGEIVPRIRHFIDNEPTPDDEVRELTEDELEVAPPSLNPPEIEPIPDGAFRFRAGTFNAYSMRAHKAIQPVTVEALEFGTGRTWEAVFGLMEYADIDILAVQEVLVRSKWVANDNAGKAAGTEIVGRPVIETWENHPLLKVNAPIQGSQGKYVVLKGDVALAYSRRFSAGGGNHTYLYTEEYLPIVYDSTRLTCTEKGMKKIGAAARHTSIRQVHLADCKTLAGSLEFRFISAHFAADSERTLENIGSIQEWLSNFAILGGDINSNPFHALKSKWSTVHSADRSDNTAAKPVGGFTKIHEKPDLTVTTRKDRTWWMLDDIIHSTLMKDYYVPGSKRIIYFGRDPSASAPWLKSYYGFSDHLPVVADYRVVGVQ